MIRVGLRVLLDGQYGETVLFRLPEIPLPEAAAGIRLGGPVALEGVLGAFYEGLRLATLLLCFGAANVLANAKRLLKSTPSALHEIGVAVTVALTIAPQLIESAQRVRTRAPAAPQHARRALPHHPADRDSRHDRRARPFARCSRRRWTPAASAAPDV